MNSSFLMTSNRRAILLNFVLFCLMTLLSYMIFQDLLMTFLGGLFSSFVFRVLFSKGNMREFGKSQTITASNGKIFSRKHKRIVVAVMAVSLFIGWYAGVLLKNVVPDFLTEIMAIFIFQIPVKITLFILDLPIGTFHEDQRNVLRPTHGVNSDEMFTSPIYKHLAGNFYHHVNR